MNPNEIDPILLERLIQLEEQLYSRDRAKEIADWYASRETPGDPVTSEEAKFADCTVFSQEVKRLEAEVERLRGQHGCGPMVKATLKQMVFEIGTLRLELIAAQESEAVWKTEADKADQRRLEAEDDLMRTEIEMQLEIDKAEAEVERLKALFNKLAEEVECGPECVSRFGDHCNCSRLKRANKVIIDFEELTNTKNGTTTN